MGMTQSNGNGQFSNYIDVRYSSTLGTLYVDDRKKVNGAYVTSGPYSQILEATRIEIGEVAWKKGYDSQKEAYAAYSKRVKEYNESRPAGAPEVFLPIAFVDMRFEYVEVADLENGPVYTFAMSDPEDKSLYRVQMTQNAAKDMVARISSGAVKKGDKVDLRMYTVTNHDEPSGRTYANIIFHLSDANHELIKGIQDFNKTFETLKTEELRRKGYDLSNRKDPLPDADKKIIRAILDGVQNTYFRTMLAQSKCLREKNNSADQSDKSSQSPEHQQSKGATQNQAQHQSQSPAAGQANTFGSAGDFLGTYDNQMDDDIPF